MRTVLIVLAALVILIAVIPLTGTLKSASTSYYLDRAGDIWIGRDVEDGIDLQPLRETKDHSIHLPRGGVTLLGDESTQALRYVPFEGTSEVALEEDSGPRIPLAKILSMKSGPGASTVAYGLSEAGKGKFVVFGVPKGENIKIFWEQSALNDDVVDFQMAEDQNSILFIGNEGEAGPTIRWLGSDNSSGSLGKWPAEKPLRMINRLSSGRFLVSGVSESQLYKFDPSDHSLTKLCGMVHEQRMIGEGILEDTENRRLYLAGGTPAACDCKTLELRILAFDSNSCRFLGLVDIGKVPGISQVILGDEKDQIRVIVDSARSKDREEVVEKVDFSVPGDLFVGLRNTLKSCDGAEQSDLAWPLPKEGNLQGVLHSFGTPLKVKGAQGERLTAHFGVDLLVGANRDVVAIRGGRPKEGRDSVEIYGSGFQDLYRHVDLCGAVLPEEVDAGYPLGEVACQVNKACPDHLHYYNRGDPFNLLVRAAGSLSLWGGLRNAAAGDVDGDGVVFYVRMGNQLIGENKNGTPLKVHGRVDLLVEAYDVLGDFSGPRVNPRVLEYSVKKSDNRTVGLCTGKPCRFVFDKDGIAQIDSTVELGAFVDTGAPQETGCGAVYLRWVISKIDEQGKIAITRSWNTRQRRGKPSEEAKNNEDAEFPDGTYLVSVGVGSWNSGVVSLERTVEVKNFSP